jgi:hypothetical protein
MYCLLILSWNFLIEFTYPDILHYSDSATDFLAFTSSLHIWLKTLITNESHFAIHFWTFSIQTYIMGQCINVHVWKHMTYPSNYKTYRDMWFLINHEGIIRLTTKHSHMNQLQSIFIIIDRSFSEIRGGEYGFTLGCWHRPPRAQSGGCSGGQMTHIDKRATRCGGPNSEAPRG